MGPPDLSGSAWFDMELITSAFAQVHESAEDEFQRICFYISVHKINWIFYLFVHKEQNYYFSFPKTFFQNIFGDFCFVLVFFF